MIEHLWMVGLGFVAAMLGSMIGLGGGIIMVPVMTVAGFAPTAAVSNSLYGVLAGSISSTVSYSRRVKIDYGLALRLALPGVPGAVLGVVLSAGVKPDIFQMLFAVMMVMAATYLLMRRRIEATHASPRKHMVFAGMGVSFLAGIASAFFGIGGGLVLVPFMVIGMGMSMKQAVPISMTALIVTASAGVVAHTAMGHPEFLQAGLLIVGCLAGGRAGAALHSRTSEWRLRMAAATFILLAAAKLIYDATTESVAAAMHVLPR